MTAKLTYVFDAYCGWCYGFGPAIREFAVAEADRIDLEVISGGLFTGAHVAPVGTMPHIADVNRRITELTGARFGRAYRELVADGSFRMDSTAAATGFAALRSNAPNQALALAEAMQAEFYRDGLGLSAPATYRHIAERLGLDADRVVSDFSDPRSRAATHRDFSRAAQLGVHSYPTLLLHTHTGSVRLGGPASSVEQLSAALHRQLATTN